MTWLPLLLADPSPCLRYLVLRDLFERPTDDPELEELAAILPSDPRVAGLLSSQRPDGSWDPKSVDLEGTGDIFRATCQALKRLGYFGFPPDDPVLQNAAEFLLKQQTKNGSWPLNKHWIEREGGAKYTMIPLQTALPLQALAIAGFATDPRVERGYSWLLDQLLPDGTWPAGIAAGDYTFIAGYRKMPHSTQGCRTNTTASLIALAHHPTKRMGLEAKRSLDLLLGRETRETTTLGFEVMRVIGVEPTRGFFTYHSKFDLALLVDLCGRIGASRQDPRVDQLVTFLLSLQSSQGIWEYVNHPEASRWLTYDLLKSLNRLDIGRDWFSTQPRVPFRNYAKAPRRY